jgi:arylsulfatase A-like enzyme
MIGMPHLTSIASQGKNFLFTNAITPKIQTLPSHTSMMTGLHTKTNIVSGGSLKEESLIIVTSDHGESLVERSFWGHDRALYEKCLRVLYFIQLTDSLGVDPAKDHHFGG